jgi:uncharacterized membrane protein
VEPADVFCAGCGARQTAEGAPPPPKGKAAKPDAGAKVDEFLGALTPQNASVLCYIPFVGWIACIVMLAADRFREDRAVRFHAFQGLYVFVLWLFVEQVFGPITRSVTGMRNMGHALQFVVVGTWIFMLVKTSQGANFRLPILGELAERSVSEQK